MVYAGCAADREVARKRDLFFPPGLVGGGGGRARRMVKPNVVLSSYETVLKDQMLLKVRTISCISFHVSSSLYPSNSQASLVLALLGGAGRPAGQGQSTGRRQVEPRRLRNPWQPLSTPWPLPAAPAGH